MRRRRRQWLGCVTLRKLFENHHLSSVVLGRRGRVRRGGEGNAMHLTHKSTFQGRVVFFLAVCLFARQSPPLPTRLVDEDARESPLSPPSPPAISRTQGSRERNIQLRSIIASWAGQASRWIDSKRDWSSGVDLMWATNSESWGFLSASGMVSRAATALMAERFSSSCFSYSCLTEFALTLVVTVVRRGSTSRSSLHQRKNLSFYYSSLQ